MIQIENKAKCCGCTACYSICPTKCILMVPDEEGFLYPLVEKEHCVDCHLCEKVCPIVNKMKTKNTPMAYVVQHKEKEILYHSASGGAYSAIGAVIIDKGGTVYGAGYTDRFFVEHMCAKSINELEKFRSSKYVQSRQRDSFVEIKGKLDQNELICYSGTPCQVAGLKSFLGKEYKNLITVDLVCKGVASPEVLRQYVTLMEKKYNSEIVGINFKRKTYGYHSSTMSVDFINGFSYSQGGIADPMMRSFRANICLRPSCGDCAFKGESRVSDLTLFDCWSYEKITGKKDNDKGHTTVLVHSKKGAEILKESQVYATIESINEKDAIALDGIMACSKVRFHPLRNEYMRILASNGLVAAIDETISVSKKELIMEFSKRFLYKTKLLNFVKRFSGRH